MNGLVSPPRILPVRKTLPKGNKYYTIHSHPKNAFGIRLDEDSQTFMVGFRNWEDAHLMACMLETYYLVNDELPLANVVTQFNLPAVEESVTDLRHLFLLHNDIDNLVSWCTINFLDFLAVDDIFESVEGKYSWDATTFKLEQDYELCRERFDYLYNF